MKEFRLFIEFFRIAMKRLVYFRASFVFMLAYWIVSISILFFFWNTVLASQSKILGWSIGELCFLNSLAYISWGLFVVFWGFRTIPDKVRSGAIDKYLMRPVSPLIAVLGEEIHLTGLYEVFAGCLAMWICIIAFNLKIQLIGIFGALVALFLGTFTILVIHGCVSLLGFWFGRVSAIQKIVDQMDEFQRYPIQFFGGSAQKLLIFVMPVYFPGTLAASSLLGKPALENAFAFLVAVCIFWIAVFILLYRKALVRYESSN
jgi:ABC-2 type transport system permease protein